MNSGRSGVVMPHYIDVLTPDYDPWQGYEWPDRAGQLERSPRKSPQSPADD